MASKIHNLNGTDCVNEEMTLELRREKKRVIVNTNGGERFCCNYDDLVEVVNNLAPKKKKDKVPEGVALPTDGVA